MVGRRPSRLAALAGALVLVGCGAAARDPSEGARLTVTDAAGTRTVLERQATLAGNPPTALSVLEAGARTQVAGGEVRSIEGLEGPWSVFVNGVRVGPAERIRAGDRAWWDRRADAPPAVVGSFPEPFRNGIDGERLPIRIECGSSAGDACDLVLEKFKKLGIVAGKTSPGTAKGTEVLRVAVGLWPDLLDDTALRELEASGVFGRFEASGRRFVPSDGRGRPGDPLGAGTGVLMAAKLDENPPVWAVTGTDEAGLRAAADALEESVLNEKFALAISEGLPVPLPAVAG